MLFQSDNSFTKNSCKFCSRCLALLKIAQYYPLHNFNPFRHLLHAAANLELLFLPMNKAQEEFYVCGINL